jgi:hypothetical protein
MWNWKDPNGLDVHPWMVGYRIPEVKLFRLRLGFWNCSPLIRVRVRFCACFQDALRALPVAATSWGFCSCIGRDSVDGSVVVVCWSIHQPTSLGSLLWVSVSRPVFWSPTSLVFAVFFRREIWSRLCWLLQIVGRRIGSTRVVSEVSGFNLLSL